MSKISVYLENIKRKREEESFQTISSFADELRRTPESLLEQLLQAGLQKKTVNDLLSQEDKAQFLKHLQAVHLGGRSRKKISMIVEPESSRILKAVEDQENGAEWDCLRHFFDLTFADVDATVDPALQRVVNLIFAKSFFLQALPTMKRGRPKSKQVEELGLKVAQDYWDMRDSGIGYSEAVGRLANTIHKDERQVMRFVEKHKPAIGLTLEERNGKRERALKMRQMYQGRPIDDVLKFYKIPSIAEPPPDFEFEDYLDYFEERICAEAKKRLPTDKKEIIFFASEL